MVRAGIYLLLALSGHLGSHKNDPKKKSLIEDPFDVMLSLLSRILQPFLLRHASPFV